MSRSGDGGTHGRIWMCADVGAKTEKCGHVCRVVGKTEDGEITGAGLMKQSRGQRWKDSTRDGVMLPP